MKKYLILILTLMLCLPLAACGGTGSEEGSGEDGDHYAGTEMPGTLNLQKRYAARPVSASEKRDQKRRSR